MDTNIILEKWIKENEKISFWGASERAMQYIDKVMTCFRYGNYDCTYDSFVLPRDGMECKLPVRPAIEYSPKNTKMIVCATRKQAYYEIVNVLEQQGAVLGEDYIDVKEIANLDKYEKILPYATYAPWRIDNEFMTIFEKVCNNTLVDIYRLYSLYILSKETLKCSRGDALEIGVWRGGSGALISHCMNLFGVDVDIHTYLCDTFCGVVKAGTDELYQGGEHSDTSMEIVQKLLDTCKVRNVEIVQGIFPDDCYELFEHKSFRIAHIDVDAYLSAKEVFEYVWPRVVKGGIVIFDDYGFETTYGVTRLCEELEKQIIDGRCIFHLNGQAIFVKV